jgi:hypothetical protein
VTGAGDTVSAALGCGIAAGLSLLEATALANLAAGVVVGKLGTATASLDELYAAMDAHSPVARGRMAVEALISAAQRARAAGERIAVIVGPVGAPDAALLARLEQAGRQADRVLLVEPADTDADALAVLAALRQVDWVVRSTWPRHAICWPGSGPTCCCPRAHDPADISTTGGRIGPGSTCTWWTTARSARCTTTSTTWAAACTAPASPARRRSASTGKFGLKSIINLRGAHGYGSYALERKPARSSAWRSTTSSCTRARRPRSRRCTPWTTLFKTIEYPALLHCKSGADRAGLGAALYRILHLGHPVEDAMAELDWKYGHFKSAKTGVLDFFFATYVARNAKSPIGFLEWVTPNTTGSNSTPASARRLGQPDRRQGAAPGMKASFQLYRRLLGSAAPTSRWWPCRSGDDRRGLPRAGAAGLLKPLVDEPDQEEPVAQWQVPLFLMLAFLAKGVAEYVASVSSQWIANKAITDLRQQVFRHQMHLPIPVHQAEPAGACCRASSTTSPRWARRCPTPGSSSSATP